MTILYNLRLVMLLHFHFVDLYCWQDDTKSVKFVQITPESYAHLTELEDEVKNLNEKITS